MSSTSTAAGPLTGLGPPLALTLRRAYVRIVDPINAPLLIATMESSPSMRALLGPTDLTTAGGFTVWRVGTFVAVVGALRAALGWSGQARSRRRVAERARHLNVSWVLPDRDTQEWAVASPGCDLRRLSACRLSPWPAP